MSVHYTLHGAPQHHICGHGPTHVEQMPEGFPHFAKVICNVCGCCIRRLPKPSTVERQRVNAFTLAKLAMHPALSDWERRFVSDVSKKPRLSPKQNALITRLAMQYLESAP